jgi:hypothetical protein
MICRLTIQALQIGFLQYTHNSFLHPTFLHLPIIFHQWSAGTSYPSGAPELLASLLSSKDLSNCQLLCQCKADIILSKYEKFEDTKGVIRSRESRTDNTIDKKGQNDKQ